MIWIRIRQTGRVLSNLNLDSIFMGSKPESIFYFTLQKTGYDSSEENNLICFHHLDRDLTLRKNLGPDSHFRKQNPNPTLQTNIDTGTKYK